MRMLKCYLANDREGHRPVIGMLPVIFACQKHSSGLHLCCELQNAVDNKLNPHADEQKAHQA